MAPRGVESEASGSAENAVSPSKQSRSQLPCNKKYKMAFNGIQLEKGAIASDAGEGG